jgi:hypothetical protein
MKLTTKTACELARALAGVTEKDHFGADAFVANGRIFATVWHDRGEVNLMLSREQQRQFLGIDGEGFTEIDNAWGPGGATRAVLEFVDPKDFAAALRSAWDHSATKRAALRPKGTAAVPKRNQSK